MTQQGAALQNYNNELVKCIEELCQKREELCRQIQQEEDEKQRLQNEVRQLTEKLARVNENLARKIASRNEFDRTIAETEAAYLKGLALARWEFPDGGTVVTITRLFADPGELADSAQCPEEGSWELDQGHSFRAEERRRGQGQLTGGRTEGPTPRPEPVNGWASDNLSSTCLCSSR